MKLTSLPNDLILHICSQYIGRNNIFTVIALCNTCSSLRATLCSNDAQQQVWFNILQSMSGMPPTLTATTGSDGNNNNNNNNKTNNIKNYRILCMQRYSLLTIRCLEPLFMTMKVAMRLKAEHEAAGEAKQLNLEQSLKAHYDREQQELSKQQQQPQQAQQALQNCRLSTKVIMLGQSAVGKTSIIYRIYRDSFYGYEPVSNIGASFVCTFESNTHTVLVCFNIHYYYYQFTHSIPVKDLNVKLEIWDTAGQERYKALAPMFYRSAGIVLLVFDLTDKKSFESVKEWISELQKNYTKQMESHQQSDYKRFISLPMIILIGNKDDLVKERTVSDEEIQVSVCGVVTLNETNNFV